MNITKETIDQRNQIFRTREVSDYYGYIEGDYEASLGKIIKALIIAEESFIVYLDEQDYVEWAYNEKYDLADSFQDKFASTLNKIGYLEEISNGVLDHTLKSAFRRLLGESLARLLSEKDEKAAKDILTTAEQILNTKSRQALIISALNSTVTLIVVNILFWIGYNVIELPEWLKNSIPVVICSLAGGIGGFIFLMIRSKTLEIEPAFELSSYKKEGILRIVYGIVGGFIIYFAINVKLVIGNIVNPEFSLMTFLLCMLGGASEKIIPGLIKKIDGKF